MNLTFYQRYGFFLCLAVRIRESFDKQLVLRIVKALLFIHQLDRAAPKASDVAAADWLYQDTWKKYDVFFTRVGTALLRAGYLTRSLRSLVSYRVKHSKRNSFLRALIYYSLFNENLFNRSAARATLLFSLCFFPPYEKLSETHKKSSWTVNNLLEVLVCSIA